MAVLALYELYPIGRVDFKNRESLRIPEVGPMPRVFEPHVGELQVRPESLPLAERTVASKAALTTVTRLIHETVKPSLTAGTHLAREIAEDLQERVARIRADQLAHEQQMREEILDAPRRAVERQQQAAMQGIRDTNRRFHALLTQALRAAADQDRAARCRWQRPPARRAPRRRVVRRLVASRDGPGRKSDGDPEPPEDFLLARHRGFVRVLGGSRT